jgi:Fe-S cluster assembly ATPase SufC
LLRPRASFVIDPFELLEERPPRRFWQSYKKGSMVSVSVPDYDGEKLVLLFQRPIEVSDVKDGKLVPSAWSEAKRRGGKRQTGLTLSLESAETLHAVLGEALKDAKAKQRRKAFSERAVNFFFSYVAEQNALAATK